MSTLRQTSSSSNTSVGEQRYEGMDERKRKRMISNRDFARRSRMRKQKTVEDLNNEVARLQCENNGIMGKIDETTEGVMIFAAENNVLRAQAVELTERFRSLISFLNSSGLKLEFLPFFFFVVVWMKSRNVHLSPFLIKDDEEKAGRCDFVHWLLMSINLNDNLRRRSSMASAVLDLKFATDR